MAGDESGTKQNERKLWAFPHRLSAHQVKWVERRELGANWRIHRALSGSVL
jgi:ABC-type tungstate transport system permease subunit